ncbi:MAG: hypothetical protein K2N54_08835 [Helicobacter sp.]|nr:hypothetical protein [Helicobacter sp.]
MSNGRIGHLHWRCDFSRTYYSLMCAVKTAPPKILYCYKIIFSVIASERRERGNQQAKNPDQARIPTRLIASLAMTIRIFLRFQIKAT